LTKLRVKRIIAPINFAGGYPASPPGSERPEMVTRTQKSRIGGLPLARLFFCRDYDWRVPRATIERLISLANAHRGVSKITAMHDAGHCIYRRTAAWCMRKMDRLHGYGR
jgi:hypothetical protein